MSDVDHVPMHPLLCSSFLTTETRLTPRIAGAPILRAIVVCLVLEASRGDPPHRTCPKIHIFGDFRSCTLGIRVLGLGPPAHRFGRSLCEKAFFLAKLASLLVGFWPLSRRFVSR